jgi:hypothetical protein
MQKCHRIGNGGKKDRQAQAPEENEKESLAAAHEKVSPAGSRVRRGIPSSVL